MQTAQLTTEWVNIFALLSLDSGTTYTIKSNSSDGFWISTETNEPTSRTNAARISSSDSINLKASIIWACSDTTTDIVVFETFAGAIDEGGGGGGIADVTNSDGRLTITGTSSKVVNFSTSQIAEINSKCNNIITVADEAAMLAITGAQAGSTVVSRTDLSGLLFQLTALPAATLGNWRQIGIVGSGAPYGEVFTVVSDNSSYSFTPPDAASHCILLVDVIGQFTLATISIAESNFVGTFDIITRSGSINAVTISLPNKTDYRTLAVNFTYNYIVATANVYTGASTNPRWCTAMSVPGDNIDPTVGGVVDGIATTNTGFYTIKDNTDSDTNGIYLSDGTLPLIKAVDFGALPLGSSVYIISGATNRGKTFLDWVNTQYNNDVNQTNFSIPVVADAAARDALPVANNSFAYVKAEAARGTYVKIAGAWQAAERGAVIYVTSASFVPTARTGTATVGGVSTLATGNLLLLCGEVLSDDNGLWSYNSAGDWTQLLTLADMLDGLTFYVRDAAATGYYWNQFYDYTAYYQKFVPARTVFYRVGAISLIPVTASGAQTVGGVVVTTGTEVLLTTGTDVGFYIVDTAGDWTLRYTVEEMYFAGIAYQIFAGTYANQVYAAFTKPDGISYEILPITTSLPNDLVTLDGVQSLTNKTYNGVTFSTSSTASTDTEVMTSLATQTAINDKVTSGRSFRGGYDASTNLYPVIGGSGAAGAVKAGDLWNITVAGTLGGKQVEDGDTILALVDTPAQTAANWYTNYDNVFSVFGRKGVVTAQANDYTIAQIDGMGAGVATFLATPTSLNLETAMLDKTGSGKVVFGNNPDLLDPTLGFKPSAANMIVGYENTVASSGTKILTADSAYFQHFTGTDPHTLQMPDVTTLRLGQSWRIINQDTFNPIAVVTSAGTAIINVLSKCSITITCIALTGTTSASWLYDTLQLANPNSSASISASSGSNLAFAGATSVSGSNTGDQIISDATITTTDITTNNASTLKHGFLPKLSGNALQYLNGIGTYTDPSSASSISATAGQDLLQGDRVKLSAANVATNILSYSTSGNTIVGRSSAVQITSDASFAATPPLNWAEYPMVTIGDNVTYLAIISKSGAKPYIYLRNLNTLTNVSVNAANYVSPAITAGSIVYQATYFTLNGLHYALIIWGTAAGTTLNNTVIQFDPITTTVLGEIAFAQTSGSNINSIVYSMFNCLVDTTGTTVARFTTMVAESTAVTYITANTFTITFTGALAATATNTKTTLTALHSCIDTTPATAGSSIKCIRSGTGKVFVAVSGTSGFIDVYNVNYTGVTPALYGTGLTISSNGSIIYPVALETTSITGYIITMYATNNVANVSTTNRYPTTVYICCTNVSGVSTPVNVFSGTTTPINMSSLVPNPLTLPVANCSMTRYVSNVSNFDTFAILFSDAGISGTVCNLFYATFTINLSPTPTFGAYLESYTLCMPSVLNSNSTVAYKTNRYMSYFANGKIMLIYCDSKAGNDIYRRLLVAGTQTLDVANCIGMAQSDALNGAPVIVKPLGDTSVVPAANGALTIGSNYFIQQLGDISTNPTINFLGKAISSSLLKLAPSIAPNTLTFRPSPTVAIFGAGGGTGATVSIVGDGYGGKIILQTGTTPVASVPIFKVSFASVLDRAPSVAVTHAVINAILVSPQSWIDPFTGIDQVCFVVRNSTNAMVASTTYVFTYSVTY